jgi:hypothetical protein
VSRGRKGEKGDGGQRKRKREKQMLADAEKELSYTVRIAIMENTMRVPQTLEIALPYNPAIPLLRILSKEPKSVMLKRHLYLCAYCRTIHSSQDMEST